MISWKANISTALRGKEVSKIVQYMAKADNHLLIESTCVFFLRGLGRSTCFLPTDMDNPASSLSVTRDEFSGSSKSNSTYSPRIIACLVFVETWSAREDDDVV